MVRPVTTLFIDLPACGRLNAGVDAMQIRLQLRSNRARNDRIARLARRLSTRQAELAADTSDSQRLSPGGIVIVVEDVKHAICLARQLRDWRIVAQDVIECGLTPRERSELAARRGSLHPNAIATVSALRNLNLAEFDVLVRAAAGPGLLPIKAVVNNCQRSPLCVVDIADRHHPLLRRWSRNRRKAYLAAGSVSRRHGSDAGANRAVFA